MNKVTQRKIYQIYKANHDDTYRHGQYEYTIAYNAACAIHTWIIRRKRTLGYGGEWHWYIPLDTDIQMTKMKYVLDLANKDGACIINKTESGKHLFMDHSGKTYAVRI